jgi:hypothetical protein
LRAIITSSKPMEDIEAGNYTIMGASIGRGLRTATIG